MLGSTRLAPIFGVLILAACCLTVPSSFAAQCPDRLPPFNSAAVQGWLQCLSDAERVLRQQPEPADVVVTAVFGACGNDEAIFAAAAGGYRCGFVNPARALVREHLLADIMARRAALNLLDSVRRDRQGWRAARPSSQPANAPSDRMTDAEMFLLREQLYHCWNMPPQARNGKDLTIEIRAIVGPDGNTQQAMIIDQSRLGDPIFRAVAESARRAFFHPDCTPLRLPVEKYEFWKNLVVDFSPDR